ncbi:aminoglycoside phosphotransferase [Salipaludibacillus neizhouensis]|uniref:Aminoglycoside phosphotransferase n=1 Tax=Salipaludibacillus neizhouensis TaxID=885475 RepID=A0A3A9K9R2_9BACI|nr:phosphotransferase [Salipaludibacillus neizhouensis]RKL69247.1 aminoglycoside phosphotransferase [Salipaludibacillus neizhouensis]
MDIQKIINELFYNGIIHSNTITFEELNGGTSSKLYLLERSGTENCVVKMNDPQVLKSEVLYLDSYKKINLLPNLLYVEQSYKYIVYSYIAGDTDQVRNDKSYILHKLVLELINNYTTVPTSNRWGWEDDSAETWPDFLLNEGNEAKTILGTLLKNEDYILIDHLIKSPKRIPLNEEPFLLHGDCGIHNFIFNNAQLSGVIDPTPLLGLPLYDLIYAFCSSPDDLSKQTIEYAANHLVTKWDGKEQHLYEEVLIGLFLRLATCMKHHPSDLEDYLKAWSYWKTIVRNSCNTTEGRSTEP